MIRADIGPGLTACVNDAGHVVLCERAGVDEPDDVVTLMLPELRALIVTLMGDRTVAEVIRGAVKDGAP